MTVRPATTATGFSSLLLIGALLVSFALLPAIARAGQVLAFGPGHANAAAGFHKAVDAPPDPAQPAADTAVVFRSPTLDDPASRLLPLPSPLPVFLLVVVDGDALRAPPAARPLA